MRAFLAVVCLVLVAWWVTPPVDAPTPLPPDEGAPAEILYVYDGDTVQVRLNGKKEKVRLLGVDTPEIAGPHTTEERCGPEASRRTKELARKGDRVTLLFDGTSERDKYGRLLARLILADGRALNEILLREGMAKRYRKFGYRKEEYARLEASAKSKKLGVWSSGACKAR